MNTNIIGSQTIVFFLGKKTLICVFLSVQSTQFGIFTEVSIHSS